MEALDNNISCKAKAKIKAKIITASDINQGIRLTKAAIKDELVYQLSSKTKISWTTLEITQKYLERAGFVLYRINVWNPITPPVFEINTSDLTRSLRAELEQLQNTDPEGFERVVTEAVQTLLEGINSRYYHTAGLPYKVSWRFEP